ncbi:MAG TPA: LysR family transcriptional regulator [Oxalicibacterium sp.]|jgi:DNA-binding transcriptional LysR family regulator|nr:LysR family transcriptional regulator [Oxalicibacterium sp.]
MDIELARTFMSIVRSGSFIAAADHLHVTQTTVTARVQNLESQLGCSLFVRNRAGAKLTADGETFLVYATQLVQTWEAARRTLPLPHDNVNTIALGCETSLCNPLVLQWTTELRKALPSHAIRVEIADGIALQNQLEHGLIHAALVHRPEYWTGMQFEQLLEEKLIQIASTDQPSPYIYIDWGEDFRRKHDAALPDKTRTALSFNLGPLAFQYLLKNGGSGYFRTRVVRRSLEKGLVQRVKDAPEFSYPVFLVYSREKASDTLQGAFDVLRMIVKEEAEWAEHWDSAP